MSPLQTIGSYETKTHLADVLRRVSAGEGFTITQRGEPIADLIPAGQSQRRRSSAAASKMMAFMQLVHSEQKVGSGVDIDALLDDGRD
ncbi:MAG: type II toxin-antitoxin system prevent-host-death family antitoxin [Betaproteobacteria bacterium]|jgi:prevent-host-death family protein|nr:type II toxin-antitoxin system prevent-host-death family antitoxin [Betaproteobacteria bacterium]MBK7655140.1 type II toxin-antitoxin system prevent-host-death family antitoxin [Betaproteobacteria bacterium]MBP6645678.1 type II toxin-antitoxin system prevent-host-death family antitoxin [Burkholderiaceae bacterium]